MRQDQQGFAELFLGQEVEVQLLNATLLQPIPGLSYPNEGILVSVDANGVVLRKHLKGRPEENLLFFPFASIRYIRVKPAAAAPAVPIAPTIPSGTPPPMAPKKTGT